MSEPFALTVSFKQINSSCGHVYAVPNWMFSYQCPMCAAEDIKQAYRERDTAQHSASRLRGYVTTLKRKRKL